MPLRFVCLTTAILTTNTFEELRGNCSFNLTKSLVSAAAYSTQKTTSPRWMRVERESRWLTELQLSRRGMQFLMWPTYLFNGAASARTYLSSSLQSNTIPLLTVYKMFWNIFFFRTVINIVTRCINCVGMCITVKLHVAVK